MLEWTTEKRKVNDLLPLEINPRKITEEKRKKLIASIEKFNLAEIPAINKDNTIIAGHQRLKALQIIGRGEEIIDVRVPNRQLNKTELKEYNLISNTHAGDWDFEVLEIEFDDVKNEWDYDIPNFDLDSVKTKIVSEKEERKAVDYDPNKQWFLNIRCESEQNAQELYEHFLEQGLDVKIVT